MSVWITIPSKRPWADSTLPLWRARGYKIALWLDSYRGEVYRTDHDLMIVSTRYNGYAHAVNELIHLAIDQDPAAQWFVVAGDDVEPDRMLFATQIAAECDKYFAGSYGVMQPTGDRWGDRQGAYIDRVAGSAWVGREFVERTYGGKGPLWPEYFHMYCDEELQAVAQLLGVFWQRPGLIQLHRHWGRERGRAEDMPDFLARANSPEEWRKAKALFESRKAAGFPGAF